MTDTPPPPVTPNPWTALRRHTDARIALGRAGLSLPSAAHLAFQLDHARARDAVHLPLERAALHAALAQASGLEVLDLHSAAADRLEYLQRPDLGRRLDEASRTLLAARPVTTCDVGFVIADGLSARAVHEHAAALLTALLPRLDGWTPGPLALVEQGRVAIGDEIGAALGARLVVVLIGERPGLSSPDSLGLYLTWSPRPGRSDAERNCISNVRPAGLPYPAAAHRLAHLMNEARRRSLSGVGLKDDSEIARLPGGAGAGRNFLLGSG
ncbi:MAG TPA: ethanolamine ammonia-lyase subunit EutC [Plasticicumulans sp.]|nr:ethanolamine ammonia-lyase subunit EutC [Plasticicumulans sp.]